MVGMPIRIPPSHLQLLKINKDLLLTKDLSKDYQLIIEDECGMAGKVKMPSDFRVLGEMPPHK